MVYNVPTPGIDEFVTRYIGKQLQLTLRLI
jgi:hypothetical protein